MRAIDLAQTVNPAEVLWVIFTLWGCVVAASNWREARHDQQALIASRLNGILMINARGAVEDQMLIFLALLADLLLGVCALLSPPDVTPAGGPSIGAMFGPWLLIGGCGVLIRLSVIQGSRRQQIRDALLIRRDALPKLDHE